VYAALGGGFALRAYFAEGSRLRALQHAQELESLRRAKQEGDLRLGVLQAQVEPHFLFNTLASVRSMVREEPARAEAAIDALVDYLRATIPRLRADGTSLDTPLAMQFEVCRSYLALMRARMGERLRVSIDLPPALAGAPFPPLLLLTLVENAIKHGIEPRPGPGHVWLAARRIESGGGALLEVEVGDDGAGLGAAMGHGVGLANVRAQLATRYGARAGLEVSGRAGGGVLATLRVPLEAGA
jgi:sensor histidine kinase YesM